MRAPTRCENGFGVSFAVSDIRRRAVSAGTVGGRMREFRASRLQIRAKASAASLGPALRDNVRITPRSLEAVLLAAHS